MPPINDVARSLLANPLPVLLLDTCCLLDVIRAPARGFAAHLAAAQRVAVVPAACYLVRASITAKEFADHAAEERDRLAVFLRELQNRAEQEYEARRSVGLPGVAPTFFPSPLPDVLFRLAESLLNASTPLDADPVHLASAYQRVNANRRPSRHGAIKDSVMVEEYLELARQLRTGGFAPPLIFHSSNSDDFCQGPARALHPDLDAEFTPLGLQFALVWPAVVHRLGI